MTQQYVGTKIVTAWESLKDGNPGYSVKYADGYTSWSPKATFDEAYIALGQVDHLQKHQQRVIAEKAELDDRFSKLKRFFESSSFADLDFNEQDRLSHQGVIMQEYSKILAERIAAF